MNSRQYICAEVIYSCVLLMQSFENDIDRVNQSYPAKDNALLYGEAFQTSLMQGMNYHQNQRKKDIIIRFSGKISPRRALAILNTFHERMLFGFAIDYLSLPIMKGKAGKDDAITLNQLDHSKKKTV